MRVAFLTLLMCLVTRSGAHEPKDGDIYATLGTFTYQTHARTHRFANPLLVGPVLTAEADISRHGGIEISMFYLNNRFSVERFGDRYIERVKRMYIATGYRHWFNERFSVAAAFSSSYAMGDVYVIRDDFGTRSHPGTSAHDITEYGFDFSVQYEPWRDGRFAAVVDARYGLSVTPKAGENSNHYGVFVGLKYFIQSRIEDPDIAL